MVSMILRQGEYDWPRWKEPNRLNPQKTLQELQAWFEIYKKAQEYDKKTDQPDCEDSAKLPILEKILKRLDELEKKIDAR